MTKTKRPLRKLNVRFLLILLGVGLVVTVGVLVVHRLQSGRIAQALLWQANRAASEERWEQAVKYFGRYLEFRPQDNEARARLGMLMASDSYAVQRSRRLNALFVLEQVLLREPDRTDCRLVLARLAMQVDRHQLAHDHLTILRQTLPSNGEVYHLLGQCLTRLERVPEAMACYRQALEHEPQRLDSAMSLAQLLRRPALPGTSADLIEEANQVIDRMVENNPENHHAYLIRWRYRSEYQPELAAEARADVRRAYDLAPQAADVLIAVAQVALQDQEYDQARAHLTNGLRWHPGNEQLYQMLASTEIQAGRRAHALDYLRQGSKVLQGSAQVEVRWALVNLLIDGGDIDEAQTLIQQLRQSQLTAASVAYLNARILIHRQNWAEAVEMLEQARPQLERSPELVKQLDLYLGQCYEQLDDPGRQLAAYRRVIGRDARSIPALLGMASAQLALGQLDEALEQYRRVLTLPNAPSHVLLEMARLMIVRNLQRGRTNWQDVEAVLAQAEKILPDASEVPLLRAQILVAQRRADEARQLLLQARDRQPEEVRFWTGLAFLAEQQQQWDEARTLLAQAERRVGDHVEIRLAQARLCVAQPGPDGAKQLARLLHNVETFAEEDQDRLLRRLAEAHFRLGDPRQAAQLWHRLAQQPRHRTDLRLRLLLCELALQNNDTAALTGYLQDIQRIEGPDGPIGCYCAARRLIRQAHDGHLDVLPEARRLLDQAARQRPTWAAVPLALAEVEDLRDQVENAIAHYRQAIELGERQPRVYRQLVQLLYRRQRFDEADQEIRRLQQQVPLSADLQRLAADISLRNQDPLRAADMALQAVQADSRDYRDYLWLGQILAASPQRVAEAEAKLRRALELKDDVPETWVALIQFLAARERTPEAEALMRQAAAKLPAAARPLVLAQCHEALGQLEQAHEQYQAVLKQRGAEAALARIVASFYLRHGRLAHAEPLLRRIVQRDLTVSDSDVEWARRNLATVLAHQADYRQLPEALTLVGLNLDAQGQVVEQSQELAVLSVEELRARAHVLATQNRRPTRTKAIGFLEILDKRHALSDADRYLLARLYEADGNWPAARAQLRDLVLANGNNPIYLAHYAQSCIRHQELSEVPRLIDKIEQLEKKRAVEEGTFGSVELKALVLHMRGRRQEARQVLTAHVEANPQKPERRILLIRLLASQQEYDEAMAQCEQLWQGGPPELAATATATVLRSRQAGPPLCQATITRIQTALRANPQSLPLWIALADLQDLCADFTAAENSYRSILALDANHLLALNNLAWMLAQRAEGQAEALRLIQRAIALAGPQAELLDTRAVVYLKQGDHEKALADLQRVVTDVPNPAGFLHLAQAEQQAGNRAAMLHALREARRAGLDVDALHPLEREAGRKIMSLLE
ncbi:MAG: tetratricopeptide repeat protein [Gemmataceae bacterium]